MSAVFISYRRHGALVHARALFERLSREFGASEVFIDLDGIDVGVDFVSLLEEQLRGCRIMLVLIDPAWATATDKNGRRRLDKENDFVRIEVATALRRGVHVAPILVDGAGMPETQSLPDELMAIRRRQALELDFRRFDSEVGKLTSVIRRILAAPAAPSHETQKEREHTERPASSRTTSSQTTSSGVDGRQDGSPRDEAARTPTPTAEYPSSVEGTHARAWRPIVAAGGGVVALLLLFTLLPSRGTRPASTPGADPAMLSEPAPRPVAAAGDAPNVARPSTPSRVAGDSSALAADAARTATEPPAGRLPSEAAVFSSSAQDHESVLGHLRAAGIGISPESSTPAASSFTSRAAVMYAGPEDEAAARSLAAMLTNRTQRAFTVLKRPRGPGPDLFSGKVVVYNF